MVMCMCWLICSDVVCIFFFFFKQKTAYEMRISDWSSDVCSSDLNMAVDRSPDGPAMGQPLGATQDSVALSLGSTVDFPDLLWPDPVDPSFLQPGGHGRGGVPHGLKRRQIVARPRRFRYRPDAAPHGGHQICPCDRSEERR